MSFVPMPPYPWFETVWPKLVARADNKTFPHAVLLSGPSGLGAMSLASAIAQLLLCRSPLEGVACNKCRACQLIGAGTHPDLKIIEPEGAGKQIKIEQVRAVSNFIANTAQQGGRKVIIMSPVDALNHNAANALLKSLEEPAGDTVLILNTSQESRLLPTIKSRCFRVVLSAPDSNIGKAWLIEQGHERYTGHLSQAANAPLKVVDWISVGYFELSDKVYKSLLDVAHKLVGPVRAAAGLKGIEPSTLLDLILQKLDDLLRLTMAPQSAQSQTLNTEKSLQDAELIDATRHIASRTLMRYRERLCEQKRQLLANTNLNAQLFNEQLFMDWAAVAASR